MQPINTEEAVFATLDDAQEFCERMTKVEDLGGERKVIGIRVKELTRVF